MQKKFSNVQVILGCNFAHAIALSMMHSYVHFAPKSSVKSNWSFSISNSESCSTRNLWNTTTQYLKAKCLIIYNLQIPVCKKSQH